jgi:hypothetical protein
MLRCCGAQEEEEEDSGEEEEEFSTYSVAIEGAQSTGRGIGGERRRS